MLLRKKQAVKQPQLQGATHTFNCAEVDASCMAFLLERYRAVCVCVLHIQGCTQFPLFEGSGMRTSASLHIRYLQLCTSDAMD
eukprot:753038-Amphidinium_carterae.2